MVGVVVTGHGGFAAGMAANVKMLAGSAAELKAVDFADGMDVEVFEKQLAEAIDSYADLSLIHIYAEPRRSDTVRLGLTALLAQQPDLQGLSLIHISASPVRIKRIRAEK